MANNSKYRQSVIGEIYCSGNIDAVTYTGDGSQLLFETFILTEQSADPGDPPEGMSIMWQSDGTGAGADGDIMIKITAGGSTKTATIIDFSAV
jgi:hypothetical protein